VGSIDHDKWLISIKPIEEQGASKKSKESSELTNCLDLTILPDTWGAMEGLVVVPPLPV
jgi:hypothetical protein